MSAQAYAPLWKRLTASLYDLLPLLALAGWLWYALSLLAKPNIPGAVVRMIAGIALLDAVLIASAGHFSLLTLAFASFALTRVAQRFVPGT